MQFDIFDRTWNLIFGSSDYDQFKERLAKSGCTKCGLADSRTRIVVDRGESGTGILAIGEGPRSLPCANSREPAGTLVGLLPGPPTGPASRKCWP